MSEPKLIVRALQLLLHTGLERMNNKEHGSTSSQADHVYIHSNLFQNAYKPLATMA